jgi:hypothetical protein
MPPKSPQPSDGKPKLKLGRVRTLTQVIKALDKTIQAMANGTVNTQDGARISNSLGIMRMCLETATLQRLEERMALLEDEAGDNGQPPRTQLGFSRQLQ